MKATTYATAATILLAAFVLAAVLAMTTDTKPGGLNAKAAARANAIAEATALLTP